MTSLVKKKSTKKYEIRFPSQVQARDAHRTALRDLETSQLRNFDFYRKYAEHAASEVPCSTSILLLFGNEVSELVNSPSLFRTLATLETKPPLDVT
jgi:hypothetical protein